MRTLLLLLLALPLCSQAENLNAIADGLLSTVEDKVVAWRRDIHQHPELGNREFRTAQRVAEHLRSLGMEVRTEVAHTGVVGILRGGLDGPVIALRADMDALPVTEQVDLPFASTATTEYLGKEVGVMHACGHDNHVAILMATAQVLAEMRDNIPGTVKFIFQPAEEGPPPGEEGGAELMIEEGVLEDVEAIFGLHVGPSPLGTIGYRPGQFMASSDSFQIAVEGKQTHGAVPWGGVDPVVVSSQIVMGLQTIVSRQLNATLTPSIISVGRIQGGVRSNIIPEQVELEGTIRTFDEKVRADIHRRIEQTATAIAEAAGARATVNIQSGPPVTANNVELTRRMIPTLERVALNNQAMEVPRVTTAEDFSRYQLEIPGMFFFLGVADPNDPNPAPNHSPRFYADERALPIGVRAMTHLALDYLTMSGAE
ncbi:amidohydrolase [Gilvimarinus sp. F26214L]|uniref:amidohydrolase n=1 Tax=Gilvimarinus sp. DZF01 TaxID=3461371 RepID=UPI004045CCF6